MAGSEGWSRIVYRKDERGVILDSQVVGADEETPEGFEENVEYETVILSPTEGPPVDESRLTVTKSPVDLRQTVDTIKADAEVQEGPSDPGALQENPDVFAPSEDGPQPGDKVTVDDGSSEHDADETIDETLGDQQEGPSSPGDEGAAESEGPPPQSGAGSGKEAWAQYAARRSVSVSEDAGRDDIIAAVKKAGHPV